MSLQAIRAILDVHRRLLPAVMLRGAVIAGLACAVMATAALGWVLGALWDMMALSARTGVHVGAALGFGVGVALLRAIRTQFAFFLDAPLSALVIAALDGAEVPRGRAQFRHGARTVSALFTNPRELSTLVYGIRQTLGSLPRLIQGVLLHVLPVAGLRRAQRLQLLVLHRAMDTLCPVILAHTLRPGAGNPWHAARHALVLHAQAGPAMLLRATRGAALVWTLSMVVFLLLLPLSQGLAALLPGDWPGEGVALAGLLTWMVKAALVDPVAVSALIRASLAQTDPLHPNPDWEDKLDAAAPAFHAMGRRAVAWHIPPARRNGRTDAPGPGETQGG